VVARSAEVKALGIPMGVPWFKIQDLARQHGIVAFSSNYGLYADMSNRVVEVLGQFTPDLEVYSIDESFLDLTGFDPAGLEAYGQVIRQRVANWLGLAVCVGIASTKTLAKLANHCAKKNLSGRTGVCDFTTLDPEALTGLLDSIPVNEVWGVGSKLNRRLAAMGIHSVRQLRDADAETIRQRISVVTERTVRELRGLSCLDLEAMAPDRQQIMSSRSFGRYVHRLKELEESVAAYIGRAAEKLRGQDSLAGALMVHIRTNPFSDSEPQYQKAMTMALPEATADTRVLVGWGLRLLRRIYRPGYAYQKAGVMLSELRPSALRQASLFSGQEDAGRAARLMAAMDSLNHRYGRGTLRVAAEGVSTRWRMKRERLSPGYTTDWAGLPVVLAH
jgi:DNA polymerase V